MDSCQVQLNSHNASWRANPARCPGIVTAEIYIEQGNGTDTAPRGQIAVTVTVCVVMVDRPYLGKE
jgi:hypothetical protein